jgi:uncharacterized membrane protein
VTGYELLVLLHIIAAITWVGAAITMNVLGAQAVKAGDGATLGAYLRQAALLGKGLFPISAGSVLVLGIAMVVVNEAWTIGQLWIVLALIGIGVTVIAGAGFFGPESRRIGSLVEQRGADEPEVRRRLRRVNVLSRLDLLLLLLIVADMVIKPGL